MRTIEHTGAFRRDFKRERAGQHRKRLAERVSEVVTLLAEDRSLPVARYDHSLSGEWEDCRECHLRPDLLLIYRKPTPGVLQLVRLGSHRELFG